MSIMAILDKHNLLGGGFQADPVVLEFGCGSRKRNPLAIGVDVLDAPCVDIVGDVYEVLSALQDASVDMVQAYHFIEHLPDLPRFLRELERVVKPGGSLDFVAPHFSNPYFYSDPTHHSFFGLYTFCYFTAESPFARQVPTYNNELQFGIEAVDLVFKSSPPFYFRHGFKKLIGVVFNSCNYMREFYEENLCNLFPCFEVRYRLRRLVA